MYCCKILFSCIGKLDCNESKLLTRNEDLFLCFVNTKTTNFEPLQEIMNTQIDIEITKLLNFKFLLLLSNYCRVLVVRIPIAESTKAVLTA